MRAALLTAVKEPFEVEDIDYLDPVAGPGARAHGRVAVLLDGLRQLARRAGQDPADHPRSCVDGRGARGRRRRQPHQGRKPRDRSRHVGVRGLLLLLDRPAGSVLGDVRPRRHLAARRQPPQRPARERGRQRRRLRRGHERDREPGVSGAERPARRVAQPASAAGSRPASAAVFNIAKVQPGSSVAVVGLGHLGQWMVQAAKVARRRSIIAVDPIAERRELAGRLGATHLVDPGRGPGRAGAGAHRGARRRLRARGGDPRVGPDPGDPDVTPGRNRRADERRARRTRPSPSPRSRSRCRAARSSAPRTATCACATTCPASSA